MSGFTRETAVAVVKRLENELDGFKFAPNSNSQISRMTTMGRQAVAVDENSAGVISVFLAAENPNKFKLGSAVVEFVKEFNKNLKGGYQLGLVPAQSGSLDVVFMLGLPITDARQFNEESLNWVDNLLWELSHTMEPMFEMISEFGSD